MFLNTSDFIKTDKKINFEYTGFNVAPMFRKKFKLTETKSAKLYVCGLGYGYYYINGKKATEDLFISPVSDYNKTLWDNAVRDKNSPKGVFRECLCQPIRKTQIFEAKNISKIDELDAFDYEEFKRNNFKVNKLGDYPLKLETKTE